MDKVSMGIIGFGYWGPNLVRSFYSLPNSRVSTIADLSDTRRRHGQASFSPAGASRSS